VTDLTTRYATAEKMLPHKMRTLVTSPNVTPIWSGDSGEFFFRDGTAEGWQWMLVDPVAKTMEVAFDHERLAKALSATLEAEQDPKELILGDFELLDGKLRFTALGMIRVEVALDTYAIEVLALRQLHESVSPDGRWVVFVRDHNLVIRDTTTEAERQLTTDGADGFAYAGMNDMVSALVMQENLGITMPPTLVWSPDSTRFFTHQLDQRNVGLMHLVRSSPKDGGRPRPLSYRYALPGDEHGATAEYFVFHAESGKAVKAKTGPLNAYFVPAIGYGWVWWSKDLSKAYFINTDRGDHNGKLYELDPSTGDVRVLVEESTESHLLFGPQQQDTNVRTLSTGEVLWCSKRSGWSHLYLYGTDGSVKPLTAGEWVVRHVVTVDEDARKVVFTAGGYEQGSDPYTQQLLSVSLDTAEITALTHDGLDHQAHPSPSGNYFVDVISRWDVPAATVLRDRSGTVVMELTTADPTALLATGWSAPERFVVKAADGTTDLYCEIYKPHDFDPAKSYPIVAEIYPGPQISVTRLRYPLSGGPMTGELHLAQFAALGFVGVSVDPRGGALRSEEFQDWSRKSGDGIFVDDYRAAITQLASERPWMDVERVGIFGHSAGAFASTRCILQAPDFFKVAVSSSGNHDNRLNHAWWGEKFFGLVDDFDFERQANATLAENLQGKLFLVHGEMDDNAVPHGTMRLVDALISANKDFDLLIIPNAEHGLNINRNYFIRKRWDYFVRHLMSETPPAYRLDEIPQELPL
jgi:dipeptidyl aminopeptidase/acylaminoacyl peptidase